MKNKIFKIVLFLVGIFIAITALGLWGPKVASYWREYQYDLEVRKAEEMAKAIETAYKNDRDGGKTPEETLDLLITALKHGNTLQASKYYELSVQPKALGSLQTEFAQYGNLQKSIDYFTEVREKGEKKCNESGDGCTFTYRFLNSNNENVQISGGDNTVLVLAGSQNNKKVSLALNRYSSHWKVTQPF
jgi:hypothetical protein